jgi:hypothetical protein
MTAKIRGANFFLPSSICSRTVELLERALARGAKLRFAKPHVWEQRWSSWSIGDQAAFWAPSSGLPSFRYIEIAQRMELNHE